MGTYEVLFHEVLKVYEISLRAESLLHIRKQPGEEEETRGREEVSEGRRGLGSGHGEGANALSSTARQGESLGLV